MDRLWRKRNEGHSQRDTGITVGKSEDLIRGLLHDAGNKHGTVRTYVEGRNMSTHDALVFGESEDKFKRG